MLSPWHHELYLEDVEMGDFVCFLCHFQQGSYDGLLFKNFFSVTRHVHI